MRNLLNFFIKNGAWFLFILYVILSFIILFTYNSYHASIYFSSANVVSSKIFETTSDITGYFNLREINKSLEENNARLENEVLNLKYQLAEMKTLSGDSLGLPLDKSSRYDYVAATVINNNVRHPKNYFSINRGKKDGIEIGQGVVDHNGV